MPRATCRCGENLTVPEGTERLVCPQCGARVRVRRKGEGDGYIRFFCSCGRRLKVVAEDPPTHGKCPDCGRVVPVPTTVPPDPEANTEEISPDDLEKLERWMSAHSGRPGGPSGASSTGGRAEVGLRLCPHCGKPLHLGDARCRECGAAVPAS